jgi:hypothetical protein
LSPNALSNPPIVVHKNPKNCPNHSHLCLLVGALKNTRHETAEIICVKFKIILSMLSKILGILDIFGGGEKE